MCVGISHVPSGYLVTTGIRSRLSGFSTFLDPSGYSWIGLERSLALFFTSVGHRETISVCKSAAEGTREGGGERERARERARESARERERERQRERGRTLYALSRGLRRWR